MDNWTREQFLTRIRARLNGQRRTGGPPVAAPTLTPVPSPWEGEESQARVEAIRAAARADFEALLTRFTAMLTDVGGQVHRASSAVEVCRLIVELARQHDVRRVVVPDAPELARLSASAALTEAGIEVISAAGDPEVVRAAMRSADLGLTGVDYALADTGTMVMLARPGNPRLASCLPPVHIAVLQPDRLLPGLADFMVVFRADHADRWPQISSGITFITGPSRTADIEQTLTIGVHGPREVHVIVWG
jgi:L-lactate dehydrogenase complex protein LldG